MKLGRSKLTFTAASVTLLLLAGTVVTLAPPPSQTPITRAPTSLPLRFEPAEGNGALAQSFVVRGPNYLGSLSGNEMELHLPTAGDGWQAVRMQLEGAKPSRPGQGTERLLGRSNYFIGNDPSEWRQDVPQFQRVEFEDVYPGIDLVYRRSDGRVGRNSLEYDFIVEPGAEPSRISLRFDGPSEPRIVDGQLTVRTPAGNLVQDRPFVYQQIAGVQREVAAHFVNRTDESFGFSLGDYNSSYPLVIDPRVEFSTYIGGIDLETINEAIYDEEQDRLIVGGRTFSPNFPARPEGNFANFRGIQDGFVAALTADGSELLWTTFIGTPGHEEIADIAFLENIVWMTGFTNDPNFPVTEPNGFSGRRDTFLFALSDDGNRIIYGRYTGGIDAEEGLSVDVCRRGDDIIAVQGGRTDGRDFPITGGQPFHGGGLLDSFVEVQVLRREQPTGDFFMRKRAGRYMGGIGEESGKEIIIAGCEESAGPSILLGSDVTSQGLPIGPLPFQASAGGQTDVHLIAWRLIDEPGMPLDLTQIGGTYIGGTRDDVLEDLELTKRPYVPGGLAANRIGVLMTTNSGKLPTLGHAFRSRGFIPEDPDMYIIVLSGDELGSIFDTPDEEDPFWATYLGTDGEEQGGGLTLDANGCVVVAGGTDSPDYPVSEDAVQPTYAGGSLDAVVTRVCGYGSWIEFSSYFGGLERDRATDIVIDPRGQYYVVGESGLGFPTTPESFQPLFGGGSGDAFVVKFQQVFLPRDGYGNAAKFESAERGGISPQEIVVGFGYNVGPEDPIGPIFDDQGILPRELGGVRVLLDTKTNPMLFASHTQTTFITRSTIRVPGPIYLNFEVDGDPSSVFKIPIVPSNPGIFALDASGTGQGAILNPDGTVNSPDNPSDSFIVAFGTGGGKTTPQCPDGGIAPAEEPLPRLQLATTATIGGAPADVLYSGSAPGLVCGANQWTLMPTNNPVGPAVPVKVCAGDNCTQDGITAAFE